VNWTIAKGKETALERGQQDRGMRVLQALDIADNPQLLPWIIIYI